MQLYMSHTSPYARKVRVFGLELGLEAQLDEVPVDPTEDPEALVAVNPVSKIPALVTDDGMNIHDSRVIFAYLASLVPPTDLYPQPADPQRWPAMTLAAHCDAILDAAVAWRLEQLRQPGERSIFWQGRWKAQIERALDALPDRIAALPAYRPYAELLTAVAIGYLEFRHKNLGWRGGRPALAEIYDRWSKRPSFIATRHPSA
ncbi:glutathione S-transferase N-terminal domain-containing protein [Sphingoaurantiacus capsulatus]|uniref:Glutathione S-transferase N-terminal domain-containing protein n=1 Tax=Sphingoaurantiacus capsulatus TaxID=1771310 RepID=A0ABV7XAF1_9SPHN